MLSAFAFGVAMALAMLIIVLAFWLIIGFLGKKP